MDIFIDNAGIEHHSAITKICKQSPYTKDFTNQIFSSEECYQAGRIRIAFHELIVGFTCFRHRVRKDPTTVLYFVGVDKLFRRQKIGSHLMWDLQKIANRDHVGTIEFKVMKDNPAVSWYEKLGFSKIGEAYDGKAWVMKGKLVSQRSGHSIPWSK